MKQKRFANLRVNNDADSFFRVSRLVEVYRAQSVGMAHYWDPSIILNIADELVAPAGDHEVDVLIQVKERVHLRTRLDGLNIGVGEVCP